MNSQLAVRRISAGSAPGSPESTARQLAAPRRSSATLRAVTSPEPGARRGAFISIEGPEGGGKTRQAQRLRNVLVEAGLDVVLTREPGGTGLGEAVRELLLSHKASGTREEIAPRGDALLFNAARAQLVSEVIEPALAGGQTVICTRFADSTLAYQGFGQGLPLDELRRLERFATGGLKPDLTLLLDLPPEVGLARKTGTEVTRFEAGFDLEFHRRVREGFRTLADREPDRFVVIDASGPPDSVFQAVLDGTARLPLIAAALRSGRGAAAPTGNTGSEPGAGAVRIQR
jgi:dTMP kinase